jgi:hypothetical protein
MERDMLLFIAGAAVSGLVSWLITAIYYRKSLTQQSDASEAQISRLTEVIQETQEAIQHGAADAIAALGQAQADASGALLRQRRIEESVAEYRRAGTPVRVIDTYNDLSDNEKAELLDTVLLRVRGRPARDNKYRRPA